MGAGVVEVLALEIEPDPVGQPGGRQTGQRSRSVVDLGPEAVCPVDRRGATAVVELQLAQLGPETRVVARVRPSRLQLVERRHERLGHVSSAEVTVQAPATVLVRLEERLRDGRRADPHVRPVEPGRLRAFHEQGNAQGVLAGPRPDGGNLSCGRCRRAGGRRGRVHLHAGGDVDADRGHFEQHLRDVRGVQSAGEDDRDLARHGGRDPAGNLAAGPSGERASGGIEKEPFGAGCEVRPACLDCAGSH